MSIKFMSLLLLCMMSFSGIYAQNNSNNSNKQVKITTQVRSLPTLAEQVSRLEQQLEWVKTQPALVNNGTAAKYEQALAQKQAALRLEEEERKRMATKSTNKKK